MIPKKIVKKKKKFLHLNIMTMRKCITLKYLTQAFFSSTFLQLVNSSKNSTLNWVMKLNRFICSKSWKYFPFYSPIHLSGYFCNSQKCIFQWSGDLHFQNPYKYNELSNKQSVKKLNLWRKTAVGKSALINAWSQK